MDFHVSGSDVNRFVGIPGITVVPAVIATIPPTPAPPDPVPVVTAPPTPMQVTASTATTTTTTLPPSAAFAPLIAMPDPAAGRLLDDDNGIRVSIAELVQRHIQMSSTPLMLFVGSLSHATGREVGSFLVGFDLQGFVTYLASGDRQSLATAIAAATGTDVMSNDRTAGLLSANDPALNQLLVRLATRVDALSADVEKMPGAGQTASMIVDNEKNNFPPSFHEDMARFFIATAGQQQQQPRGATTSNRSMLMQLLPEAIGMTALNVATRALIADSAIQIARSTERPEFTWQRLVGAPELRPLFANYCAQQLNIAVAHAAIGRGQRHIDHLALAARSQSLLRQLSDIRLSAAAAAPPTRTAVFSYRPPSS